MKIRAVTTQGYFDVYDISRRGESQAIKESIGPELTGARSTLAEQMP